jgi:hypothetical protein
MLIIACGVFIKRKHERGVKPDSIFPQRAASAQAVKRIFVSSRPFNTTNVLQEWAFEDGHCGRGLSC